MGENKGRGGIGTCMGRLWTVPPFYLTRTRTLELWYPRDILIPSSYKHRGKTSLLGLPSHLIICSCYTRCFFPFLHHGDWIVLWKSAKPHRVLCSRLCLPVPACSMRLLLREPACSVHLQWSLPGPSQAPGCLQSVEVTHKPKLLTFSEYTYASAKMSVGCVSRTEIALILTRVRFSFHTTTKLPSKEVAWT